MIESIISFFRAPEDEDPAFIRLSRNILIFTLLATLLPIVAIAAENRESVSVSISVLIIAGLLEITALVFVLRGKVLLAKVIVPSVLIAAMTIIAFEADSIHDIAIISFPAIIIIAVLLQGKHSTIATLPIVIFAFVLLGTLDILGVTATPMASETGIDDILIGTVVLLASSGILNLLIVRLNRSIDSAKANELAQIKANTELRELQTSLEQRVEMRTVELEEANQRNEQRAQQFEAVTLVGNAISSIRSLDELLSKITELISQQFGYYHAGIFLNDAHNEYAVLSAANSEGGQRMLDRGHQLKIGEQGIVGYAISNGEPRIALDVGEDAVYFDNPDMPDTHSEMALPLKIGEAIVGALDVQSTEASAFSEEDINVLSLLADQASMAIENARLFDQARKSLAESEALYRQYLRQAWNRLPKERKLAGFRYNVRGASPIETKRQSHMVEGSEEATEENQNPRISVPIAIRGETIGTLSVQVPDASTFNDDQLDMVNAVAERVALSAENARLFEETTRRAERERLVSDITVKIRGTNNPDAMIQTALEELKQALGASKVQLIPHTLQKKEAQLPLENPMQEFKGNPAKKSRKK